MRPDSVTGAESSARVGLERRRTNLANVPAVWEGAKRSLRHLKHLRAHPRSWGLSSSPQRGCEQGLPPLPTATWQINWGSNLPSPSFLWQLRGTGLGWTWLGAGGGAQQGGLGVR